jgi:hypothetical protein
MINIKMLIRNLLVMTLLLFVIVSTSYAQFRTLNLLATTPLTLDPNTRFQKTVPCRKLDVTLVEIEKRLLKEGKKLTTARNKKEMQAYQKLEKRYLKLVKIKKKLNSKRLSSCETKTSRSTREAFRDLTRLLNSQLEQRDVRAQIHSYPFISEISQTQNEKSILILNEGDSPIFIKDWLREIDEQQEKIVELARGGFERMRTERTELAQLKTPNPLQESALGMDDLGESGNLDDLGSSGDLDDFGTGRSSAGGSLSAYTIERDENLRQQVRILFDTKLTDEEQQFFPDPLNDPESKEPLELLFLHYYVIRPTPDSVGQEIQLHLFILDASRDYTLYKKATAPQPWKNRSADYTGAVGRELSLLAEQFAQVANQ